MSNNSAPVGKFIVNTGCRKCLARPFAKVRLAAFPMLDCRAVLLMARSRWDVFQRLVRV